MKPSHPAVRAPAAEPCPFCGCGSPLAAHVPIRRPRRLRATVTMGRHLDGSAVSRVGPVSIFAPNTDQAVADGIAARATFAAWEAHRLAGEVPVIVDGKSAVEWRKVPGQEVAA